MSIIIIQSQPIGALSYIDYYKSTTLLSTVRAVLDIARYLRESGIGERRMVGGSGGDVNRLLLLLYATVLLYCATNSDVFLRPESVRQVVEF